MDMKNGKWTKIFSIEPGNSGTKKVREEDLKQVEKNFSEFKFVPPIVANHPDTPKQVVLGKVIDVLAKGQDLFAKINPIPLLKNLIDNNFLTGNMSASFYKNLNNKGFTLRHLGIVDVPICKTLEPLSFSECETIESLADSDDFGEYSGEIIETEIENIFKNFKEEDIMFKNIQEALEAIKKGGDEAKKAEEFLNGHLGKLNFSEPSDNVKVQIENLQKKLEGLDTTNYSEEIKKLNDAIDAKTSALDKAYKEIKEKEHSDFAEKLCGEGKLIPALKQDVIDALKHANDVATIDFSEKEKITLSAKLKKIFSSIPPYINYGELVKPDKEGDTEDFAEVRKYRDKGNIDQASMDRTIKAKKYAKENKVSFEEALKKI